jgi:alkylation response protein AidB-like acyl-CoA dehydrogenase
MYFALSDDQAALRDGVRELLTAECTPAVVRAAWADPATVGSLWSQIAELGLPGAAVPSDRGGLGLGACDIVPLLEEAGRVAVPVPIVETAFVAGPLLAAAAGRDDELERLLAGEMLVACALDGSSLIPYGQLADMTLISTDASAGRSIRTIDGHATGTPVKSIDGGRAVLILEPAGGGSVGGERLELDRSQNIAAWQRGVLGAAAELIGLARTLLDHTTAYVKDRRQFGVAIGSFQAIKHHLADALIALEFAAPAVMRAAWSMDQGAWSTDRDVAMAKALASEAAERIAAIALQCHGAIAYTTEYDLHLFAKGVWAGSRQWGSAEQQRQRVAVALGL